MRILLAHVIKESELSAGLMVDAEAYDAWFRAKVQQVLADSQALSAYDADMDEVQAKIDRRSRA